MSPSTMKAVFALLEKCGIRPKGSGGTAQTSETHRGVMDVAPWRAGHRQWWGDVGLVDFLPDAAEELRFMGSVTATSRREDSGTHLSLMRQALQAGRGVAVIFRGRAAGLSLDEQAELVQKLAEALDSVPDAQVTGLTMRISDVDGISHEGHVMLDASLSAYDWAKQLEAVNMEAVQAARSSAAALQSVEQAVAQLLQVPLVATTEECTASSAYTDLLSELAALAERRGAPAPDVPDTVPLFVMPPHSSCFADATPNSLCQHRGMMMVSMDASADTVYRCIQQNAAQGAALLKQREDDQKSISTVCELVMGRLRLRRLARDESVSRECFVTCCHELVHNAETLRPIAEGMSLRVSHANNVSDCGTYVEIPWDFRIV
mmetsp:Transcript_25397/g.47951  ORF Transcript_25397/g.47951 Transcript_25397/m.47951 type:complete len:376 (+) Transcript_25397:1-1128(+)